MTFIFRNLSALLLIALTSLYAGAQQKATVALNAYLDDLHRKGGFNGNVLVAENGKVILERAVGDADASGKLKLDLADRFQLGSIGKEFDSVGLLMLKQQGRLVLNDPLSKFFPELPSWASTVTIDELLHYTSGLPRPDFKAVHSDAENWAALQAVQHLDSVPGTLYVYNNNDVFLRRRVIEKVSGMSFAEFVTTREFPVAGVHHAVIDPVDDTSQMAKSFSDEGVQDKLEAPISGWVSLSLADLLAWSRCMQRFCLINPKSTRLIGRTQMPEQQSGLGTVEMRGDAMIRHVHDGSVLHYRALLSSEGDRTILILGNQKIDVYGVAAAIKAILDATR